MAALKPKSAGKDFQVFLRIVASNCKDNGENSSSDGKDNLSYRLSTGEDTNTVRLQSTIAAADLKGEQRAEALAFDSVFSPDADNATVYKGAARDIVDSTLLGYHGTVIAIGDDLSGSSATLSEVGPPNERRGVVLRAAEQMFHCVKRSHDKTGSRLVVLCSHVAVVEDECFDLLAPLVATGKKNSRPPKLQFDGGHLHGLSQCQATSTAQVGSFLIDGRALLKKLAEKQSEASRPCHSAFMFTVEHAQFGSSFSPVSGTLTIVDVGYSANAKSSDSSLSAFLSKIAELSRDIPEQQPQAASSNLEVVSSGPSTSDDALLLQILGGALGGNCRTALICHTQEQVRAIEGAQALLSLVSNASRINNTPNKRDLAERALMTAYLRELGITRMVLEKEKDPASKEDWKNSPRGHNTSLLASASGTQLRDVKEKEEYVDGRHLLHREEPDNHVTGSNVTATSEVEGNLHATEAIASALAAAVLDKEESSSLESEEEYQCPAPMGSQEQHAVHSVPVEDCAMVPATSTDAAYREERNGATSGQSPPHTDEASSVEQRLEEKHLKLKSGKKRMMHRDESTACDAVQDACLGREAITIEVLLGLLQDPDHGAHRAQVNKDVLIRKDFGGLFSGVSIVQWMMEALDGISSEEEAESLGQLLVDKGALVHSEGSHVFASAESLFYYTRIGRTGPSGLSEAEIQSLLNQSQPEDSMTAVDPSLLPYSQRLPGGSDSDGSEGPPQTTWNRTDIVASGKEEGDKTTWTSINVQLRFNEGQATSWNETDVNRCDGVDAGGATEVVAGADRRPATAERLHSSGGRKKKHKKEGQRKGSASGRREAKGSDEESFDVLPPSVSEQGDERIRFYNDREEVPAPPLTADSLMSQPEDDNVRQVDYLHGNHEGLYNGHFHGNNQMYVVQEGDESACAEGMEYSVDADGTYLGSVPTLSHHHSMLLGTEMGNWSASQLFVYESQLALAGVDQPQPDLTGQASPSSEGLGEAVAARQKEAEKKTMNKYSAKPNEDTLKIISEDEQGLQNIDYPTPLHMQAATGPPQKSGVLRELIMMYGVNTTDTLGRSPLMFSILSSKLSACSVLIECGATVDQPAGNGVTPLQLAAYVGNKEAVSLLLRKGATIGLKDSQGRNALHYSTVPESPACLQLLLRSAYDSVTNAADESLLLPIHWAIANDHYRHVAVLIKKGATVEGIDQQGRTCLNYAICCSAINSFEVLLSTHPHLLSLSDSTLTTPLHLACAHPSTKFLDSICKNSRVSDLDVNCRDNIDRSPLHYAAICDRLPAVKELLKRGADRNVVDKKGRTALDYALKHGEESEVVQLLKSSKPTSTDCHGNRRNKRSAFCAVL